MNAVRVPKTGTLPECIYRGSAGALPATTGPGSDFGIDMVSDGGVTVYRDVAGFHRGTTGDNRGYAGAMPGLCRDAAGFYRGTTGDNRSLTGINRIVISGEFDPLTVHIQRLFWKNVIAHQTEDVDDTK
ncbi:hypothetical protein DPMN_105572 [Dreissena polymorpha]|uniref:Uncharacterized protein n=1 Tax=Dreissena polymorpha TaxID=45954 RepID=A0A9D4QHW7_DREPO|nr:hypothetical protein DPMN_105572 [Dreissena polymorpha]